MKKDETATPNVWEAETLNDTSVKFAMQSDDKCAPSVFVLTVEKAGTTIEVQMTAAEGVEMLQGMRSCIPPYPLHNNVPED